MPLTKVKNSVTEFKTTATGAVARGMEDKLADIVSVKDFGAVGNGVADDTAAIQNAINSLLARGGTVYLPGGRYKLTAQLFLGNGDGAGTESTKNAIKLLGEGAGFAVSGSLVPTILSWQGALTTEPMLVIDGKISDGQLQGVFFECNGLAGGITATSFSGWTYKNIKIVNPAPSAVALAIFGGGAPTGNYNIHNVFENISIALLQPSSVGLLMDGDFSVQNDTWISQFRNMRIETVAGATNAVCAWFKFVDSCSFYRCHFDSKPEPTSNGIIFDSLANDQFPAGMAFYDCSIHDTTVLEDGSHKIRKNYFYGHGTYDLEITPTHPNLCGITDTGVVFGDFLYNEDWVSYVPTIAAGAGTLTSASATARYKAYGKTVFFKAVGTITTNGTGSAYVSLTLPAGPGNVVNGNYFAVGRNTATGGALTGQFVSGTQQVHLRKFDDTYPGADGAVLEISGFYEVA